MLLAGCVRGGCQPGLAMSGDLGGRSRSQAIADVFLPPSFSDRIHLGLPHSQAPPAVFPEYARNPSLSPAQTSHHTLSGTHPHLHRMEIIQSMGLRIRGTKDNLGGGDGGGINVVAVPRLQFRATTSIPLATTDTTQLATASPLVEKCVMVTSRRESTLSLGCFPDKKMRGSITRYSGSALLHYCTSLQHLENKGKINLLEMASTFTR
ncbi:uncharacterized protein LOC116581439 [Mustela erminea]|uniref:uncharacterized protein LOC116581439 n=1 Tax=Mustela erminea TaxID=36723 RepID=UPI001387681C|nr:uncharacterized protein LOC116581439 [Mustela erminea]